METVNQSVVFELDANNSAGSPFSVESNGSILVSGVLDYETNSSLAIHIRGTEGNRTLVNQYVVSILDVNESQPPVVQPDPFEFNATALSVSEDALVGTEVGYVYRTSGDLNQSVVFELDANNSAGSPFSVESNGSILVSGVLDYETNSSLAIHIRGTEGNRTLVNQYVVSILDVNETQPPVVQPDPFEFNATALSVSEDALVGTEVGYVYRTSGDVNQSVVFELDANNSAGSPFSVESNGSILVSGVLDYETNSSLAIHIRGTEGNRTLVNQYVVSILDVNETQPPVVQPDPFEFNATVSVCPKMHWLEQKSDMFIERVEI